MFARKDNNLLTAVHRLLIEEVEELPEVSKALIRAVAVVKSVADAFSSTLLLNELIWPACTTVPKAPAVPIARLRND